MKRALFLVTALALCGCTDREPLRVGSKSFTENVLLGEAVAILAEQSGIPVERNLPYGNSFDCQQGIERGEIEVYLEYNGTGLARLGVPAMQDGEAAQAKVRELYQPFGLRWLDRVGFDNGYVLVMRPDRAHELGVRTISDLVKLGKPIRFACTDEFLQRPVDGMTPMLQRYGLRKGESVTSLERGVVYRALIEGRVDVAVGYATDGQILELGLVGLEDDQGFFPAYEPSPLVRAAALERWPGLEAALAPLAGAIDEPTMRALNQKVELDGADPSEVITAFLAERGLLRERPARQIRRRLGLAVSGSQRDRITGLALRAVRRTNASRHVEIVETDDVVDAVLKGEAFLGLMSAEAFYGPPDETGLPVCDERVEAVAVLGYRAAHVIRRRADLAGGELAGIERLGIGPAAGGAGAAADMLLGALDLDGVTHVPGDYAQQLEALRAGELDAVLVLAELGSPALTLELQDAELGLAALADWDHGTHRFRYPFLRAARIPAERYPHQARPVETVQVQVVLVGPAPRPDGLGDGGPVGAVADRRQPIPAAIKQGLRRVIGNQDSIDPAIPGRTVGLSSAVHERRPLNPAPEVSVLTFLILAGFGYFMALLARGPKRRGRAGAAAGASPSPKA